uniref:Uncharacterized protein n=1 Tax=Nelumbo nucifera TaxID=4432 RepID=A0A822Y8S2_NELNU|nr:TPA_asm: hypothetical protein HUJ06_027466 [Nelumbo nucifera]
MESSISPSSSRICGKETLETEETGKKKRTRRLYNREHESKKTTWTWRIIVRLIGRETAERDENKGKEREKKKEREMREE